MIMGQEKEKEVSSAMASEDGKFWTPYMVISTFVYIVQCVVMVIELSNQVLPSHKSVERKISQEKLKSFTFVIQIHFNWRIGLHILCCIIHFAVSYYLGHMIYSDGTID